MQNRVPLSPGRPKARFDERLLMKLRDQGLGFKRIAKEYVRETGQSISHATVRDCLIEAATNDSKRLQGSQ